jgi:quercetin dioxygenase-like cupin family protein
MIDRLKLPFSFDPMRLKHDLDQFEHLGWTDHFVKQNYQGSWSVIPLRGTAGATHPIMMIYSDPNAINFEDTPFLQASPYFQEVLQGFQCPLEAVRLMKLSAGSIIKEHTDFDLSFEQGHARLHIPVVTNPEVDFQLNHERVVMLEGECWYLKLSDPHSVANRGEADRVHLVIDALVNPWLKDVFQSNL